MVNTRVWSRLRIRLCLSAALLVTTMIVADGRGNGAQVSVPPAASLDVHVAGRPRPVRISGRPHLAYELHITNFRSVDLFLASIDIIGDGQNRVARYQGQDLAARLARVGAHPDN